MKINTNDINYNSGVTHRAIDIYVRAPVYTIRDLRDRSITEDKIKKSPLIVCVEVSVPYDTEYAYIDSNKEDAQKYNEYEKQAIYYGADYRFIDLEGIIDIYQLMDIVETIEEEVSEGEVYKKSNNQSTVHDYMDYVIRRIYEIVDKLNNSKQTN